VLCALGSAIKASVPADGIAARIGGEEFTIYLPGAGLDAAHSLAQAIRDSAAALSGGGVPDLEPFTISIGVAARRQDQDLESLMMAADRRLYAAKRGGRDRVVGELAGAA
jgi:diguanylate cyclase (GGDEF)-like protein